MPLEPYWLLLEYCFQVSDEYMNVATRWFEGLISKDIKITKEVYSVQSVEFDRQVSWIPPLRFQSQIESSICYGYNNFLIKELLDITNSMGEFGLGC